MEQHVRAVILTPTVGRSELRACAASVDAQQLRGDDTHLVVDLEHWVVVDGPQYAAAATEALAPPLPPLLGSLSSACAVKRHVLVLPENSGRLHDECMYGHRIYAAFSQLVNHDYVLYLDDDNTIAPEHVLSLIQAIRQTPAAEWSYALRSIHDAAGQFVCEDDCQSLGKWPALVGPVGDHFVDTSCYCLPRAVAVACASTWSFGLFGADLHFSHAVFKQFPHAACNGRSTLHYRVPQANLQQFFKQGNAIAAAMHKRAAAGSPLLLPWRNQSQPPNAHTAEIVNVANLQV